MAELNNCPLCNCPFEDIYLNFQEYKPYFTLESKYQELSYQFSRVFEDNVRLKYELKKQSEQFKQKNELLKLLSEKLEKNNSLSSENNFLSSLIEKNKVEINNLKNALKDKTDMVKELKEKNKDLKQTISSLFLNKNEKDNDIKVAIKERDKNIDDLKCKSNDILKELNAVIFDNKKLSTQVNNLNEKLFETNNKIKELHDQLNTRDQVYIKIIQDYNDCKKFLEVEKNLQNKFRQKIDKLGGLLEEKINYIEQMKKQISIMNEENIKLHEIIESNKIQNENLKNMNEDMIQNKDNLL